MEKQNMSKTFLIIGATSSLAQSLCRTLAAKGISLILAGRDEDELLILASDLSVRYGVACHTQLLDLLALDFSAERAIRSAGEFHGIILASGDMELEANSDAMISRIAQVNYVAPAQLASHAAEMFAVRGSGSIIIIGSVAGDRGRASNYVYGSAKAAIATFASGLRHRFGGRGVHVLLVKPGFVDTPMTWGMKSLLIASRESVAEQIVRAIEQKKNVVYAPFFWRFIMLIIIHIPEAIFKKMKI